MTLRIKLLFSLILFSRLSYQIPEVTDRLLMTVKIEDNNETKRLLLIFGLFGRQSPKLVETFKNSLKTFKESYITSVIQKYFALITLTNQIEFQLDSDYLKESSELSSSDLRGYLAISKPFGVINDLKGKTDSIFIFLDNRLDYNKNFLIIGRTLDTLYQIEQIHQLATNSGEPKGKITIESMLLQETNSNLNKNCTPTPKKRLKSS